MPALALLLAGAGVLVATVVIARRSVREAPVVDVADPWAAFSPRSDEEIERDARVRLWPIAGVLSGVVLVLSGVLVWQLPGDTPVDDGAAVLIELSSPPEGPQALSAPATPEATASPEPSPTVTPTPQASRSPSPTPRRTPAATRTPAPSTPKPTTAPTPTPSPTPPPTPAPAGPNVGASTSCFRDGGGNNASVSYSANARDGERLSEVRLLLDGQLVQNARVGGRTSYSDSFSKSVSPGTHTFTVQATQANGGSTTRNFSVCT